MTKSTHEDMSFDIPDDIWQQVKEHGGGGGTKDKNGEWTFHPPGSSDPLAKANEMIGKAGLGLMMSERNELRVRNGLILSRIALGILVPLFGFFFAGFFTENILIHSAYWACAAVTWALIVMGLHNWWLIRRDNKAVDKIIDELKQTNMELEEAAVKEKNNP